MFSWCIIASPSHSKVCRVFDGLGVRLMFHVQVNPLLVLWHASRVRLFMKKYPCMHSSFVHLQNNPLACIPHLSVCKAISSHAFLIPPFTNKYPRMLSFFIPFVVMSCLIHLLVFAITHDEMTSNP